MCMVAKAQTCHEQICFSAYKKASCIKCSMSHDMRKHEFYVKADQHHYFHYTDSTVPLLLTSENPSFQLSSQIVQTGWCLTWSETPKTVFPCCFSYMTYIKRKPPFLIGYLMTWRMYRQKSCACQMRSYEKTYFSGCKFCKKMFFLSFFKSNALIDCRPNMQQIFKFDLG